MRLRSIVLLFSVLLVSMLVLSACGGGGGAPAGGGETTITGNVTKVDTGARTFTVESGGRTYDFRMTGSSQGDINEIKEHMDLKRPIEVKYKGTTAPYEVVAAD